MLRALAVLATCESSCAFALRHAPHHAAARLGRGARPSLLTVEVVTDNMTASEPLRPNVTTLARVVDAVSDPYLSYVYGPVTQALTSSILSSSSCRPSA